MNFVERNFFGAHRYLPVHASRKLWDNKSENASDVLYGISRMTGATVINPEDVLCTKDLCLTHTSENTPIYRDASHLNQFYVRDHIEFLDFLFK